MWTEEAWYLHIESDELNLAMVLRASEFERRYAERSGVTVEQLHSWGRFPEPCHCQGHMCTGWQMGHQWEDAIIDDCVRVTSGGWRSPSLRSLPDCTLGEF